MSFVYFWLILAISFITVLFVPAVLAYIRQISEYKRNLKTNFVVICFFELTVLCVIYGLTLAVVIRQLFY